MNDERCLVFDRVAEDYYRARRGYPPELVEYMRGNGKKKVLFGSNFPMLTPVECLAEVDALGLSEETRELFLGGNARHVFKLR